MSPADEGGTVIDGSTTISQFNTEYDAALDDTNYTTVGGLLFGQLGRLPRPGDLVQVGGFDFEILSMAGRRVERVRVVGPPEGHAEGDGGAMSASCHARRSRSCLPARSTSPVRRCGGGARSSGRRSRCSRTPGSRK